MPESETSVRLEVADGVATIRVDRPKVNALSAAIQLAIGEAAEECARRDDVAAVVLTGGERVFAAGADIKEMAELDYAAMVAHSGRLQQHFSTVARLPKPVIAAVNGYALGAGLELALCADVRIAADDVTLGLPEVTLGVVPGAGGTQRLARLIGPARAKELIFTGRPVRAEEALQLGLVNQVLPAAEVQQAAVDWARRFVGGPRLALQAAKECVDRGMEVDLDTGLQMERQQFAALFATEDRTIGMQSFIANGPGKAQFVGR
ncbi:MAG: enoyl-CoA hydratase/isomerase family protein [Propionibacteriaceae bacterium]